MLFVMSGHDISDEKRSVIGPVPEKKKAEIGGRKRRDDRLMLNGMLWILTTGGPGRIYLRIPDHGILFTSVFSNG